jgi:hypothetical protein
VLLLLLLLLPGAGEPATPNLQQRLQRAKAFIERLPVTAAPDDDASSSHNSSSSSSSRRVAVLLRGPALAQLELLKRELQLGLAEQQQLVEALLLYHDRCGAQLGWLRS